MYTKTKTVIIIFLTVIILASCAAPSPLTGAWADSMGNRLILSGNFNFSLKVVSADQPVDYRGTYNVINNSIMFSVSDGRAIVSEWDIRGQILYLNWPAVGENGKNMFFTLYRTGK